MRDVFVVADNIVSPLGPTTRDNFRELALAHTGIRRHEGGRFSPTPFYASLFETGAFEEDPGADPGRPLDGGARARSGAGGRFTKFERMLIASVTDALGLSGLDASGERTVFILSSTKGNISLLETEEVDPARISLAGSAERIAAHFGFRHSPLVVSHACISGLQAMITGLRLIRSGQYDHAVVCGADTITQFILSGFQSFMAVSPEPCRPFDADRQGVTLGEAAGTVVLSADVVFARRAAADAMRAGETGAGASLRSPQPLIRLLGGAVSNDANHISGPSRTGEELYMAIRKAMTEARVTGEDVDFISAHGTATLYNDDMEAKAIHLAGLADVPVNSLKGYYGHTLGAAGLIESIISMQSLRENLILPTLGYERPGTEKPVHVLTVPLAYEATLCLKTASGFGGCNAAILLHKS